MGVESFSKTSHRSPSVAFFNLNSILLPVTLKVDSVGLIGNANFISSVNLFPSELDI